mmetsp:Transcript_18921/g.47548  ORF Transcript_18921/g.47548 Transcript_18921/m.47548 type:complete len:109 (-) Transcript_18921:376-702(-)
MSRDDLAVEMRRCWETVAIRNHGRRSDAQANWRYHCVSGMSISVQIFRGERIIFCMTFPRLLILRKDFTERTVSSRSTPTEGTKVHKKESIGGKNLSWKKAVTPTSSI